MRPIMKSYRAIRQTVDYRSHHVTSDLDHISNLFSVSFARLLALITAVKLTIYFTLFVFEEN